MEQNSTFIRKLPIPKEIKEQYPLTEEVARIKKDEIPVLLSIYSMQSVKPCFFNSFLFL